MATDNGLLATLLVSTTGSTPGTVLSLNMLNTINGPSGFGLGGSLTLALTYPHNQLSITRQPVRQWNINGDGSWDSDANWTPFAPYARGDAANFYGTLVSGTAVVVLDGVRTVGSLNFNNTAGTYDIEAGSGGSLCLDNGTSSPLITNLGGSHKVRAPVVLTADTNVSVASGGTLTFSGGISGAFSNLNLSGAGKFILVGANAYGATNIAAGSTLQVGTAPTAAPWGPRRSTMADR